MYVSLVEVFQYYFLCLLYLNLNVCVLEMLQFMRCFENHKVVSFEVLKNAKEAVPIHKPVFCETHPSEAMKFFCYSCMVS